jgi:hypothetical protein
MRMRWVGHVAWMGEMKNGYNILIEKSEGMRSLGRPKHRWEDNIRMVLREIRWEGVKWIHLAQDRDQWGGCYEHGNEPSGCIKGGEFLD